jgi:transposase, IS6 family
MEQLRRGTTVPGGRFARRVPSEVVTDAAPVYPRVLDELVPAAWHHVEQYANNPIEADHGQLKRWLRSMRGLQLGVDAPPAPRIAAAFTELAQAI